jgi:hypothetical protein
MHHTDEADSNESLYWFSRAELVSCLEPAENCYDCVIFRYFEAEKKTPILNLRCVFSYEKSHGIQGGTGLIIWSAARRIVK